VHSHSQIVTLPRIPSLVEAETDASKKYKKCPYCDILRQEAKSERRIASNSCVAFAPYASRYNYEAWIIPKRHINNITEMTDVELKDCAVLLKKILVKIKKLGISYNYFLHYGHDLHFHIEITPRRAVWAGFELSTDMIINSVSPESAASYYRAK
jgi:UDPglucose--hexose-1-phosphate uridylyltransferase